MKRSAKPLRISSASISVARRPASSANALLKAPRSQSGRANAGGSAARTCRSDDASLSTASSRKSNQVHDKTPTVTCREVSSVEIASWDQAAREVERVAGPEVELLADRTWIVLSRVVAVAFQSQFDRGAIELPPLRARELKHENVMGIEMGKPCARAGVR